MILPSVLDPFFAIAHSDPDRPAVVDNGVTVGYGQLARWAGAVADLVATRAPAGAPPVAIHAHHSVRDIAAVLGTLAAGRGYVPVADGPEGHADRALRALGCRELIATAETGRLPAVDRVLRPNWGRSRAPLREAGEPVRAQDPAYVLFTSGSTGAPKAAAVPHGALHAVLPHLCRQYGAGPDTVALNFHRADGDTSLEEVLPALLSGGLVVLDEDSEADLDRVLTDHEVTLVNLPVDYWHLYTGHLLDTGRPLPASVETFVIGGEAVRPDMLERWHRLGADDVVLLNTYGSTETALVTHSAVLAGPGAPAAFPDGVPIGRPLPSVRQAVVPRPDVPDGPGELLVSGPQLATGYIDDPERTAARFVEDAPGAGPGRWYRTGDLVTEDADGSLVFHGRIDHQVKIRGHRVDLLDVEGAVGRLPEVTAVAAAAHTKGEHTVLVAFVVLAPETGEAPDAPRAQDVAAALRERLRAAVPDPFVPDRIIAVPELVHTRTGKVDRAGTRDRYL
ncbi:AMP-binding protein [Streptomyces bambusae]|uniref:AMP-binding protein n=1 Tax=Streptomyces bambusae TaxID=1550616 RepID=A0ABS6ZEN1_9ACTN|nr:AMP-binding protein [Streptomyces bambusae]MBW5486220.1 AMP-binding protein [Streptomyces bambusae]